MVISFPNHQHPRERLALNHLGRTVVQHVSLTIQFQLSDHLELPIGVELVVLHESSNEESEQLLPLGDAEALYYLPLDVGILAVVLFLDVPDLGARDLHDRVVVESIDMQSELGLLDLELVCVAQHALLEAVARCLLRGEGEDDVGVEGVAFVFLEAPRADWGVEVDGQVLVDLEAVLEDREEPLLVARAASSYDDLLIQSLLQLRHLHIPNQPAVEDGLGDLNLSVACVFGVQNLLASQLLLGLKDPLLLGDSVLAAEVEDEAKLSADYWSYR